TQRRSPLRRFVSKAAAFLEFCFPDLTARAIALPARRLRHLTFRPAGQHAAPSESKQECRRRASAGAMLPTAEAEPWPKVPASLRDLPAAGESGENTSTDVRQPALPK